MINFRADSLHKQIEKLLTGSDAVYIAVAWATACEGLDLLLNAADRCGKEKVKIIVGVHDYITSPKALKNMDERATLRIYGGASGTLFHPKIYISDKGSTRKCWVGSANLTRAAFHDNMEGVAEFDDINGEVLAYFMKLWGSPNLKTLAEFDLGAYEEERAKREAAAIQAGLPIPPQDTERSNDSSVATAPVNLATSDWLTYLSLLRKRGRLDHWTETLDAGFELASRNWEDDLSEREKRILFGHVFDGEDFSPLGHLHMIHVGNFSGSSSSSLKNRKDIGEVVREARVQKTLNVGIVQKLLDNLLEIHGCGYALATRLLTFARPDWFVVANKKSFGGLGERLGAYLDTNLNGSSMPI